MNLKDKIKSCGMETFIAEYKTPDSELSNSLIEKHPNYSEQSYETKIREIKAIRKLKLEKDALLMIASSSRTKKECREKAIFFLKKDFQFDSSSYKKLKTEVEKLETKNELIKYIENNKEIKSLRNTFRQRIDKEFKDYKSAMHIVNENIKTFDTSVEMEAINRAHIVPVWYLVKENRLYDISNPANGLIVDPTTHYYFDRIKSFKFNDTKLFNKTHSFNIDKELLHKERKKFIDEWINNIEKFKI